MTTSTTNRKTRKHIVNTTSSRRVVVLAQSTILYVFLFCSKVLEVSCPFTRKMSRITAACSLLCKSGISTLQRVLFGCRCSGWYSSRNGSVLMWGTRQTLWGSSTFQFVQRAPQVHVRHCCQTSHDALHAVSKSWKSCRHPASGICSLRAASVAPNHRTLPKLPWSRIATFRWWLVFPPTRTYTNSFAIANRSVHYPMLCTESVLLLHASGIQ